MQETLENQVWSLDWEDALGKEMAIHSSILAWEIPRSEEPGGLPSIGLQKSQRWLSNNNLLFKGILTLKKVDYVPGFVIHEENVLM